MKIDVIIPAYQEDEDTIKKCLSSVLEAIRNCPCGVDVLLVPDIKGIGVARNLGAAKTHNEIIVFFDCDCTMSKNFLKNIYDLAQYPHYIGGGTKWVKFDKYSLGRILGAIPTALWLYWHQVTFGAFWIRRWAFERMNGFIVNDDVHLDYDFALRLKKYAKKMGGKFRSIKRSYITWSTRGCDKYGEWFWLKRYRLFKEN